MNHSILKGFSFGTTSGIITTMGLMVGLHSGTHSKGAVLGGILTIAIADAFSDAIGIHISEESENVHTGKEIWVSTFSTFIAKFMFAMAFAVPIMFFSLDKAIIISVIWGLTLLGVLSYYIARLQNRNKWEIILEHLIIGILVVGITHLVGDFIGTKFH
jgi:VIT1/CCC1 family predicted Fe2+/Mn2+ transporter